MKTIWGRTNMRKEKLVDEDCISLNNLTWSSAGLTVTPSAAQIVSAASNLQLACAMNLDTTYSRRVVTWKLNGGSDVSFPHLIF